jgi:DNA-binding response OmpR family regulator
VRTRANRVARDLAASELARGSHWSLAVVDHVLPDRGGLQLLDTLRAEDPTLPTVMLTGQGSEETAIEVIRHGASDYVVKGRDYLDALERRVRSLLTA